MASIRKRRKGVKEGWVIIDKWQPKKGSKTVTVRTGLRWAAGAWDPQRIVKGVKKPGYTYKSFPDGEQGYQEARAWAEQMSKDIKLRKATATKFTLEDVGKKYVEHLELTKDDNKRHVDQVRQCVRLGIEAGLGDILAEEFPSAVETWLRSLKTSRGKVASASLKNKFLGFIKSICVYARRRHGALLNRMDVVDPFKKPKAMKEVYSLEELRAMLSDAKRDDPLYVYIALMIYLGFRPSECLSLRSEDVNIENETVRLRHDAAGNKLQREALVPLQPELKDILVEAKFDTRPTLVPEVFVMRPRADSLLRATRSYIESVGVAPRKMIRHAFRNSFASLHAAIGTNFSMVLTFLNHSDVTVSNAYQSAAMAYRDGVKNWTKDGSFYLTRGK